MMVYSLAGLEQLTEESVSAAVSVAEEETKLSRILVTDEVGYVLYDSRKEANTRGQLAKGEEVQRALEGNDAFTCRYENGAFRSWAASPVLYQSRVIGAVYAFGPAIRE